MTVRDYEDFLRDYWKVQIKFIRRWKAGSLQRRWQATFPETGCKICTEKKFLTCISLALRQRTRAINESINKGQLLLLF